MSSLTTPASTHHDVVILDDPSNPSLDDPHRRSSVEMINPDNDVIIISSPPRRPQNDRVSADPILVEEPPRKRRRRDTSSSVEPHALSNTARDASRATVVHDVDEEVTYEARTREGGSDSDLPSTHHALLNPSAEQDRSIPAFDVDAASDLELQRLLPPVAHDGSASARDSRRSLDDDGVEVVADFPAGPATSTTPAIPSRRPALSMPSLFTVPPRPRRSSVYRHGLIPVRGRQDSSTRSPGGRLRPLVSSDGSGGSARPLMRSEPFSLSARDAPSHNHVRVESEAGPITPDEIGTLPNGARAADASTRIGTGPQLYGMTRGSSPNGASSRNGMHSEGRSETIGSVVHPRAEGQRSVNQNVVDDVPQTYGINSDTPGSLPRRASRAAQSVDRVAQLGRLYGPTGSHPMFTVIEEDSGEIPPALNGSVNTITSVLGDADPRAFMRRAFMSQHRRYTANATTASGNSSGQITAPGSSGSPHGSTMYGLTHRSNRSGRNGRSERGRIAAFPHGFAALRRYAGGHRSLNGAALFLRSVSGDPSLDYEHLVRLDEQLIREKNRADKEQIEALPVIVATAADKEIRCCVCMCDVEEGETLRILPCSHKYHRSCIDEWLTYNGCCPVDKKRIGLRNSRRLCPMHRTESGAAH